VHLPLWLLTPLGLVTELSQKMQTHTARVSNAIVTVFCTHLPFVDLPEKLKSLFFLTIINAHD
jgi:hypothetical protein